MLFLVDYTRVVLTDGDPTVVGSDYINANYISVSHDLLLQIHHMTFNV